MKTTRDGKAKPTNDGSCISLHNPMQLYAGDISQCNECQCFSQQESHNRKPPEHCCAAEPCQATLGSEVLDRERERERERERGGGGVKRSAHIAMQFLVQVHEHSHSTGSERVDTLGLRAVEVIICMIARDFSVISNDVITGVSLSLSLPLTKVTHAQYRKRFRASYNTRKSEILER